MSGTKLEDLRSELAAGSSLSIDDQWFLIEEISRYRNALRHAKYQTVQVTVTAKSPDDGPVEFVAHVVASEEAAERAVIHEIRRTLMRYLRLASNREEG